MFRTITIIIYLAFVLSFSSKSEAAPSAILTEQAVMDSYINHPDSCLMLLEKAGQRQIATDMPDYKLDLLRAMCYEIKGDYPAKERYVRHLLENDSVKNVPERKLKMTVMLAGVLERQNKYENAVMVCREAINQARQLGVKKDEAEMLSTMARIYAGMKNNDEAYKYFHQAVDLLKNTEDVRDMAYLSTIYGELMTFLIDTGRGKEALEIGKRREELIGRMSRQPGPPPGYIDQQYGFLYAKMALLLVQQGSDAEAAAVYDKYQKLDFSDSYTGRAYIVPYLLAAKRYREAYDNNGPCIREYPGDTISYDYLSMLQCQAEACRGLKDYKEAVSFMQRCYAVQDSIYRRESESKAQEYAASFAAKEHELQSSKARAESQREKIIVVSALTVVLLFIVILFVVFRNLRKTKRKNRIDAKRIDELIAQKNELRKKFMQNYFKAMPDEGRHASENRESEDKDYLIFMQMEAQIVRNKLFLNPRLSRDEILKTSGISKNSLVPILRKYSGCTNLNDYINRLRLEYAVALIKDNKLFTIDAIAESSGFNSRSTFYRVFQNVFGMTPLQYLETIKTDNNQSDTSNEN